LQTPSSAAWFLVLNSTKVFLSFCYTIFGFLFATRFKARITQKQMVWKVGWS